MKKIILTVTAVLLTLLTVMAGLSGCNAGDTNKPGPQLPEVPDDEEEQTEVSQPVSLLADPFFAAGLDLMGLESSMGTATVKRLKYGSGPISWKLAQWWSKYNLKDGSEMRTGDKYTISDSSKLVEYNFTDKSLKLEVNARHEFDTYNTKAPAKWPHLLLEQELTPVFMLEEIEEVYAGLDFTLNKAVNQKGTDKGLHAQFAWFIYIVNRNPESPGYGNFLWFGFNIYDSTREYAAPTQLQDTAVEKGNFIYTVGAKDFLSSPIAAGEKMSFRVNMVPYVKAALAAANEKGFMLNTAYEDCAITGTNIGWEVFDRWDVSITIEKIALEIAAQQSDG